MEDGGVVLPGISFASCRRSPRIARAGWRSMADSVSRAVFFGVVADVAWAVESECVAELCTDVAVARSDFVSGVVAGMFAAGDDFRARRSGTGWGVAEAISRCRGLGRGPTDLTSSHHLRSYVPLDRRYAVRAANRRDCQYCFDFCRKRKSQRAQTRWLVLSAALDLLWTDDPKLTTYRCPPKPPLKLPPP